MQFPSAKSDLLMFAPSLKRSPRFVVTVARSEPAKSINDILESFTWVEMPETFGHWRMKTCVQKVEILYCSILINKEFNNKICNKNEVVVLENREFCILI